MTATVTSTGEDASAERARRVQHRDRAGSSTARTRSSSPVQVKANDGAFAPLRTDNGPLTLLDLDRAGQPRTRSTLAFKQTIGADEGLRTGCYAKTLTFTLSTTNP